MSADRLHDSPEFENDEVHPLEVIAELEAEGHIQRTLSYHWIAYENDNPIIVTHILTAPSSPVHSIEELNQVAALFPESPIANPAEFESDACKNVALPQRVYIEAVAEVDVHITAPEDVPHKLIGEMLMRQKVAMPEFYQRMIVHIFPSPEIAQAVAQIENSKFQDRNSKSGGTKYTLEHFDPSREAADLASLDPTREEDRRTIMYLDTYLPVAIWQPED